MDSSSILYGNTGPRDANTRGLMSSADIGISEAQLQVLHAAVNTADEDDHVVDGEMLEALENIYKQDLPTIGWSLLDKALRALSFGGYLRLESLALSAGSIQGELEYAIYLTDKGRELVEESITSDQLALQ